ncbi:MAG: rhamnogalacturonan acetylesterase [Prevotella sp.]|nr:rhamnogalacturonan acetylesterase [Prevotella sp.]
MRALFLVCLAALTSSLAHAQSFDIDLAEPQPVISEGNRYGYDLVSLSGVADAQLKSKQPKPFYFSFSVPDGNYRVTLTLGSKYRASETTVRAESRRLYFENVTTRKKELKTLTFIVNKRSPRIDEKNSIKIKPREKDYVNWDNRLTLEFTGKAPAVTRIEVEPDTTATTLYLCGNSTVVDQEYEPWSSWGQMVTRWFNDRVSIANYAESGLTATSFLAQNRFDKILSTLRKGDYVFCEFGHNDQKERAPGSGAYYNFAFALKRLIDGVRSKGATVVFITPTQRRAFDKENRHILETHGDYPDAMREVARREQVPVIELHDMTRTFFETLGFEDSKRALVHYPAGTFPGQVNEFADNTHFNPYGAYEVAKMVVMGMKSLSLPVVNELRDDWKDYDPAQPDDFNAFYWPNSLLYELKKPDGN